MILKGTDPTPLSAILREITKKNKPKELYLRP